MKLTESSGGGTEEDISASAVCLHGMHLLMPLINMDLLHYPTLCKEFFKMITFVADIYPEKVCTLPGDHLLNLFKWMEVGMEAFGPEVLQQVLDFLHAISMHLALHPHVQGPARDLVKVFLKVSNMP